MELLTNRFVIALLVPTLLFLAGGFGKKLVRGSRDWHRKDWYLGIDATLAAMSAALINIFEIARLKKIVPNDSGLYDKQQVATAVFIAISFFMFLYVLSVHQNWESKSRNARAQKFWLLGLANLIGLGLMFVFVLIVKGVE